MTNIIAQRERVVELITEAIGSLVDTITIDAQDVRPLPGKAVVLIDPPDIEWESFDLSAVTWKFEIIAGTGATQVAAMDLIFPIIERLQTANVNMADARPVSFVQGAANLAAYQITLNPLD